MGIADDGLLTGVRGSLPDPGIQLFGRGAVVVDFDRIGAPLRFEDLGTFEIAEKVLGKDRRRHHGDPEVGTALFLNTCGEGEGEVAVEVPFVEFIENDRSDAGEIFVVENLADKRSLRDVADFGACGNGAVKANLVSHLASDPSPTLRGDAGGEHPGGDAARFEDDDFAAAAKRIVEDKLGDLGRFPGSGRGTDDGAGAGEREGISERFAKGENGELVGLQNQWEATSEVRRFMRKLGKN